MKIRSIVLFLFISLYGFSQAGDSASPKKPESYFSFTYDNDFFSATDRYYTQGIILSLVHEGLKKSPLSYTLLKLRNADKYYHGLHLEQDVFTPRSIRYKGGEIYYGERPFTAIFFLSQTKTSLSHKKLIALHSQIDLGILGPAALGEEEQKGIHKALDNIEPQGWSNQLSQDIIINYRARIEKGLISTKHFELAGTGAVRVGTLYTDASVGIFSRAGILNPYFSNLGLPINHDEPSKNFKISFFVKSNLKAVGYNATLQGGLTNSGNIYELSDESITRIVADVTGGIVIGIKRLSLEYSRTYITKEFEGGLDHGWGRCSILLCL